MRNLVVGLVVVGLVAVSSFGAANTVQVKLVANPTVLTTNGNWTAGTGTVGTVNMLPGDSIVVRICATGNGSGLEALGGSIVSSVLSGNPSVSVSNMSWLTGTTLGAGANDFNGIINLDPDTGEIDPTTSVPSVIGAADSLGGVAGLGSHQNSAFASATYGATTYKAVFSYTVKALTAGQINLSWVDVPAPGSVGGWFTLTQDNHRGSADNQALVLNITPEPATMALLALGGLLIARRRRA